MFSNQKLTFTILLVLTSKVLTQTEPSCDHVIYCQGPILHTVQMAGIFEDSKTFVDLQMIHDIPTTLQNFEALMNETNNSPTIDDIKLFVNQNFQEADEFEPWDIPNFDPNPAFFDRIHNTEILEFARNVVKIWPNLARKIKQEVIDNPSSYSILPVTNGFIVPGGRFREFHYWDSYWIINGLLISELYDTAKGMIDNFASFIERYGHIPNGARNYFLNRSQPPFFALMVKDYIDSTSDFEWLENNIQILEKEMEYWLDKKTIQIKKNGVTYVLAHYDVESGSPRPESYRQDVLNAQHLQSENEKMQLYADFKTAAESGWDFSSRWVIDDNGGNKGNISYTKTRRVIPVDVNALLCKAFKILSDFHVELGNIEAAVKWFEKYTTWQKTIEQVLYDEEDGIWYDFDSVLEKPRKYFFPSNFAPLWAQCYLPSNGDILGRKAAEYFVNQGLMEYQGGIPATLNNTGEQWDFPNAWPPLQDIVVFGLEKSGNEFAKLLAKGLAVRWINANMIGYNETQLMYEKYDAVHPGKYGGGGEYEPQAGFGWTNGIALKFIKYFFTENSDKP